MTQTIKPEDEETGLKLRKEGKYNAIIEMIIILFYQRSIHLLSTTSSLHGVMEVLMAGYTMDRSPLHHRAGLMTNKVYLVEISTSSSHLCVLFSQKITWDT